MNPSKKPIAVWMPGALPVRVEVHMTAEDTGGAFCLAIDHPPTGWGLPPHRHVNESESVYIVEGRFEMDVDGTRYDLGPGDSCFVARGAVHSGQAIGEGPIKRVVVFAPGGVEGFFLTAGASTPETDPDLEKLLALAHSYGWRFEEIAT